MTYPPGSPPPPPPGPAPQNGMGTAALVVGIVQVFCLGTIGSILAVVLGKIGMNKADQGLASNRGSAKAGFILGIIGLVLSALVLIGSMASGVLLS
jgi:U5 snRNP spliceosome subunit